jgi:hypothetical protein
MHSSAWKVNSEKSMCGILHKVPLRAARMDSEGLHAAGWRSIHLVMVHEDAGK